VSLSHYCPSAVELLFGDTPALEIVARPDDESSDATEGLDARFALPPALREDALVDWDSLSVWERFVVATFEREPSPEAALDRLWAGYLALQDWRPGATPLRRLVDRVSRAGGHASLGAPRRAWRSAIRADLRRAVESAIPMELRPPPSIEVPPQDPVLSAIAGDGARPLCRYLAARAYACWPLYQGRGLLTQLLFLEAALAVVYAEAGRLAAGAGTGNRDLALREAVRRSDLLLVHLAEPEALAQALDAIPPTIAQEGLPGT
jgi:hypothetical protein